MNKRNTAREKKKENKKHPYRQGGRNRIEAKRGAELK